MATTIQEEIWQILDRLARSSEETDRRMQETDRRIQETDRLAQETWRQMQETDRRVKAVTQAIGRLGNRLGEFVEEMVRPAAVRLFREWGISVHQVFPRASAERDGDAMEVDLLVVNDTDAILIEVKSELKVDDVKEHLQRLVRFKKLFPQYAGFRVMSAVAAMVVPDEAARFAYRQGLFVMGQNGDTVTIRNGAGFHPAVW